MKDEQMKYNNNFGGANENQEHSVLWLRTFIISKKFLYQQIHTDDERKKRIERSLLLIFFVTCPHASINLKQLCCTISRFVFFSFNTLFLPRLDHPIYSDAMCMSMCLHFISIQNGQFVPKVNQWILLQVTENCAVSCRLGDFF